jgi:hypothetical protein
MDRLESLAATFVEHTDQTIAELRQGRADSRREMAEFRRGSREEMDEFGRKIQIFSDKVDQNIASMEQWRVQSQKQWGEIAQKLGTFVEDIVAPNIPRLGQQIFGLNGEPEELFSAARLRVWHPQDKSRMREFDYIYATRQGWIVVESKNDPKLKDVESFCQMLAEVKEYFPQYASLPLFPIFASLSVPDHVVKYCTRHRIYALGLAPDTMKLLNLAELSSDGHAAI